MQALFQDGLNGRVPVPPEKRFLIRVSGVLMAAWCALGASGGEPSSADLRLVLRQRIELKEGLEPRNKDAGYLCSLYVNGEDLFVGSWSGMAIHCFKRDPKTGTLTRLNTIDLEPAVKPLQIKGYETIQRVWPEMVLSRKGILCVVSNSGEYKGSDRDGRYAIGLLRFQYDRLTGSAKFLGAVPCKHGTLLLSERENRLYLFPTQFKGSFHVYRIDPESGALDKEDNPKGKGLGGPAIRSPDGKHVYCCSERGEDIGWARLGEDGFPEYGGALDLGPALRGAREAFAVGPAMAFSPDGRHLYLSIWSGQAKRYVVGLFQRDETTGNLSFVKVVELPEIAAASRLTLYFEGGGQTGYSGMGGNLGWLRRDPETGNLTHFEADRESRSGWAMAPAPDVRALYVIHWGYPISVYGVEKGEGK